MKRQPSPTRQSSWALAQRLAPVAFAFLLASPSAGCGEDEPECASFTLTVAASESREGNGLAARLSLDDPELAADHHNGEVWEYYCWHGRSSAGLPALTKRAMICARPGTKRAPGRLEAWVVPNGDWCETLPGTPMNLEEQPDASGIVTFDFERNSHRLLSLLIE